MDHDTRHFRAGVGTVIFNKDKQVAWFERTQNPVGVWQFQQGGIDCNESPETTLWRELQEEVGLTKEDISTVVEYPSWTIHQYPDEILQREDGTLWKRMGQAHRWYFLELKDHVTIDLNKATHAEFSNAAWIEFSEAVAAASAYKAPIYQELQDYFEKHLA